MHNSENPRKELDHLGHENGNHKLLGHVPHKWNKLICQYIAYIYIYRSVYICIYTSIYLMQFSVLIYAFLLKAVRCRCAALSQPVMP